MPEPDSSNKRSFLLLAAGVAVVALLALLLRPAKAPATPPEDAAVALAPEAADHPVAQPAPWAATPDAGAAAKATAENPERPESPENPESPESPDNPDHPDNPENPEPAPAPTAKPTLPPAELVAAAAPETAEPAPERPAAPAETPAETPAPAAHDAPAPAEPPADAAPTAPQAEAPAPEAPAPAPEAAPAPEKASAPTEPAPAAKPVKQRLGRVFEFRSPTRLTLDGVWDLRNLSRNLTLKAQVPGDNYSALLDAKIIPDPYHRDNEKLARQYADDDWEWSRDFTVDAAFLDQDNHSDPRDVDLVLTAVDTFATVYVNDQEVGQTDNMFREYRFPVRHALRAGANRLRIAIASPAARAKTEAEKLPFALPKNGNNAIPYMNAIRKVQCHAGWDWGICLPVSGIYAAPVLEARPVVYLESLNVTQKHEDGKVELTVTAEVMATRGITMGVTYGLDRPDGGKLVSTDAFVQAGRNLLTHTFTIDNPQLWYPNGYGEQPLYVVHFDSPTGSHKRRVGLRTVEVVNEPDAVGRGLHFRVNGVDVFAKGANWIPVDALPQRQTRDAYARLLTAARDCHMNMIRVWGGGQYEKDCFYDLCDELGLLVWQDCMFACAVYPGTPEFVANVEKELDYQIRRLRTHPCLAVWCGDNECLKGLTWYKEANEKKRFYMVNYDRLNRALARKVAELDPGRPFRQSSPCPGADDFYDKDPGDRCGDIHYWDVWHGGQKFEAYYKVQPRFCSEFGYQAFPSEALVNSFTAPEDRNVFSPVMDAHQKCYKGNAPIIGMFGNYFRMPSTFGGFLYLSQVQQAVAMKTGIEYWRTLRPLCMGTLYWQLNDVWPAASWSSIEYGGRWKQMQYHARSFYAPVMTTARVAEVPAAAGGRAPGAAVEVWTVNDLPRPCAATVTADVYDFAGNRLRRREFAVELPAGAAMPVGTVELDGIAPESCFVMLRTRPQGSQELLHENTIFPAPWKRCQLRPAKVSTVVDERLGLAVKARAEAPAFFVHLTAGDLPGNFSDSSFTLLPGEEKTVLFLPFPGHEVSFADFARAVRVQDLESETR